MTRMLWAVLVSGSVLGLSGSTFAQSNNFLRFVSEPGGSTCSLNYSEPGVVMIHVILDGTAPSSAVQFSAVTPECWTGATWLCDRVDLPFLSLGNTQDPVNGISVAVNGCKEMPVYIGTIHHQVTDLSASCCAYAPGPAEVQTPAGPLNILATVDCTIPYFMEWVIRPVEPVGITVNAGASCPCELALSTSETTWGRVKALYR
ncbi:MAG TPA: hypothetical protein VEC56_02320 [Candidatus Krumholzibacteria bacterium]|nr:hypothetical protein [Candidatus Krumholzibacteria bacterium]